MEPLTQDNYEGALAELWDLWDTALPGTPEGERFEQLAAAVDAYEQEAFPIPAPDELV